MCGHVGQRICARCVPHNQDDCVSGYLQTCGPETGPAQSRVLLTQWKDCDQALDAAACASLIAGELPDPCMSDADG